MLRRLGRDAVLVPGDVPRDRDHDLGVHPRERQEADAGVAEALGDAGDRALVGAVVEELGRLHDRLLLGGEAAVHRLGHRAAPARPGASRAAPRAREAPATPRLLHDRRRRAPLPEPAVVVG